MADKNVHEKHRQRVKARFLREGLSGFEKHNVLEMLLFFTIPQKDTNEIAHELIDRFGSLKTVFEAPIEELLKVNGVGEHTATLIKFIPSLWAEVSGEIDKKNKYDSVNKIGKLLVKRYAGITKEIAYLVLLDNSWHIIDIVNIGMGSVNQVFLDTRKVVEHCIRTNASRALVSHNHPNGELIPSTEDYTTTEMLAKLFRSIHVDFLEHLLIAGDKFDVLLAKSEGFLFQRADRENFYR
ncbi:MAG: hypothetical protein E7598_03645 [Ruminococcaceae bacterium]|nr:hypothetical protein [Oscillospiraceae bacterium]